MHATPPLPAPPFAPGARVIVLEAEPGRARRERLEAWTGAAREAGLTAWLLPCDAERHSLWAGLNAWMEDLFPRLEANAPHLILRHDAELTSVLPALRLRFAPRYVTLTDSSRADEGVRNYARDRAYRIGHGVIDLLDAWHARTGGGRWAVACDGLDRCGALVEMFFHNLLRRRGDKLGLVMLAAVDPGQGDRVAAALAPFARVERVEMELPAGPDDRPGPDGAARRAAEMDEWAQVDTLRIKTHGHEMIRLWEAAGRPDRAVAWRALVMGVFSHLGYYEDAFRHAPAVRAGIHHFDRPGNLYTRAKVVSTLRILYVTNGFPEEARELLLTEGLPKLTDPAERARALYMLAMLHARHLPVRDQEAAERYLAQALEEAERMEGEEADRQFLTGFLLNGLAYVRFRQGDVGQAAALSHENYDRLDRHLPAGRHRLHRSVLLYNAGQVYAQTGDHEEAIRYFTGAMEMDPHYSEYYNDRGNVYLKIGRLEEAEADYLQAIELSPPYPEVWFNLGQARARLGRPADAEAAYARSLDLDPARREAWVGLARALHAQGRREEALAAYDGAIDAGEQHPLVLANRAALRFELGRVHEALADLDRAVALAPDNPALARNRALALEAVQALGCPAPAAA